MREDRGKRIEEIGNRKEGRGNRKEKRGKKCWDKECRGRRSGVSGQGVERTKFIKVWIENNLWPSKFLHP